MLHTAGLGFLVGVDIYDCVVVINTQDALDAFSKLRCTLGGEVSAVAGPLGAGAMLESEVHKRQAPIFTYLKSRGFYAGVQIDGTIVIERTDENERFYGEKIPVADILAGKVRHPPYETRGLMATIKAAQGDTDVDQSLLPTEAAPGDFEIEEEGHVFGVPDKEDPDPYGVLALEKEGLQIREAGSHERPTSEQFEFKPSPNSPLFTTYRKSVDGMSRRSSWRRSNMSNMSAADRAPMADMSTQTELDETESITTASQRSPVRSTFSRESPRPNGHMPHISEDIPPEKELAIKTPEPDPELNEGRPQITNPHHARMESVELDDDHEEEAVVHEVQQAAAPQVVHKARMVTVTKPKAPQLPPRNPIRDRKKPLIIDANTNEDESVGPFPSPSPQSPQSSRSFGSISSGEHVEAAQEAVTRIDLRNDEEREGFDDVQLDTDEVMESKESKEPKGSMKPKEPKDTPTEEVNDADRVQLGGLRNALKLDDDDEFHSPSETPVARSPSPTKGGAEVERNPWS